MKTTKRLTPPLKWHGGKHYLAERIVALMAGVPHTHYVEPYAGGLAVLLAKEPEGVSEVVNDANGKLMNFWSAVAEPAALALMAFELALMPLSEEMWQRAQAGMAEPCRGPEDTICVNCAVAFFICCRMSLAGRMDAFTPLSRTRTRGGMNEQVSAYLGAIDGLPAVHARLRRVVILHRPAIDVITSQDGPQTLFYLDPPYLHETRTSPAVYGPHEMSTDDHMQLLTLIQGLQGKVMLSGYRSPMYDSLLKTWVRHDFEISNHAASGDTKRRMTECVWCNFTP